MNKKLFCLVPFLLIPLLSFSFDFGFGINNRTIYKHNAASALPEAARHAVEEKALFSLWMNHYFDEHLFLQTTAHAMLGTDYFNEFNRYAFLASGDIDAFYLSGKYALSDPSVSYVDFKIGRQFFSDFSKEVAVTVLDGVTVGFGNEKARYRFTGGYTGLLYNWSNTISMGLNDINARQTWAAGREASDPQAQSLNRYSALHGSPRLVGEFEVRLPELFKGQQLTLNLLGQADLWPALTDAPLVQKGDTVKNPFYGSPIHTLYAGLGLAGPITADLYYRAFGYFETGHYYDIANSSHAYQAKAFTAALLGFDLTGYIPNSLSSSLSFSSRYASGDSRGKRTHYYDLTTEGATNTQFIPLVRQQLNTVFNPVLSNLLTFALSYSFKPFSSLSNPYVNDFMLSTGVKTFLRGSKAPVSDLTVKGKADSYYLGTEWNVGLTLLNLSDFNMGVSTGVFFPHADAFIENHNQPKLESEFRFTIHL